MLQGIGLSAETINYAALIVNGLIFIMQARLTSEMSNLKVYMHENFVLKRKP